MDSREHEVRAAAADLVAAFGQGRVEDYFACFDPGATFLFPTTADRLGSLAAYRERWRRWELEDGFRVLGCDSSDVAVQLLGDVAVLTHDVRTEVQVRGQPHVLAERETIVFARRADGRWLAVHEHLSAAPPTTGA
jgi:ketosteroid isomerase-like protein